MEPNYNDDGIKEVRSYDVGARLEESHEISDSKEVRLTFLGLAVIFLFPTSFLRLSISTFQVLRIALDPVSTGMILGLLGQLLAMALLLLLVLLGEHNSWPSVGIRSLQDSDPFWILVAFILCFWSQSLVRFIADHAALIVGGRTASLAKLHALKSAPILLVGVASIVNGCFEELGFRAYSIERLESLTGSTWVAASVSYAAILWTHGGWGIYGFFAIAPVQAILLIFYLIRRSLPASALLHILLDLVGFLWFIVPLVLKRMLMPI